MLQHSETSRAILGAFFRSYNGLGYGYLEAVYANALDMELRALGLSTEREAPIDVWYRGHVIGKYRADFVVQRRIVLELKASHAIDASARAQLFNYLRCTDLELGFLLHYGPRPKFDRIVQTRNAGRDDTTPRSSRTFPRSSALPLSDSGAPG